MNITDIEKGLFFKKSDDLVKNKYTVVLLEKCMIRAHTPAKKGGREAKKK